MWSGAVSFEVSKENGLVWVQFGLQPISSLRRGPNIIMVAFIFLGRESAGWLIFGSFGDVGL